jgi:translation elongation factor EF-4
LTLVWPTQAEPYVRMEIITPDDYVGPLMELAQNRRGQYVDMKYLVEGRTTIIYEMPLAEMVCVCVFVCVL